MRTLKAGCFLVDTETKCIALIHRVKQDDYSFPKGHVEEGEDIKIAALRETAEETKREAVIVEEYEPYVEEYTTSSGVDCACYMYIAVDNGPSDNDSTDTHDVIWTPFDKVGETLSYPSLKNTWNDVKDKIANVLAGK